MKYQIRRLILEETNFLSITRNEFTSIADAQRSLIAALAIEEKLNILLENWLEFEKSLLGGALHHLVFQDTARLTDDLHSTNRQLVNLMTTGRMYLDHVLHDLKAMHPFDGERSALVKDRIDLEKRESFEFRAMEALRNFVQHRGLAVDSITHRSHWHDRSEEHAVCRHNLAPLLRVERLEHDAKFSKQIATELRRMGETVDLRPLARKYVSALGAIHLFVREQLSPDVKQWLATFSNAQERYREAFEMNILGLSAVAFENDEIVENIHLSSNLPDRLAELVNKNRYLTSFPKHVVTSAVDLRHA